MFPNKHILNKDITFSDWSVGCCSCRRASWLSGYIDPLFFLWWETSLETSLEYCGVFDALLVSIRHLVVLIDPKCSVKYNNRSPPVCSTSVITWKATENIGKSQVSHYILYWLVTKFNSNLPRCFWRYMLSKGICQIMMVEVVSSWRDCLVFLLTLRWPKPPDTTSKELTSTLLARRPRWWWAGSWSTS